MKNRLMLWLYEASRLFPPFAAFLVVADRSSGLGVKCLLWVAVTLLLRIATWAGFHIACLWTDPLEGVSDGGEDHE